MPVLFNDLLQCRTCFGKPAVRNPPDFDGIVAEVRAKGGGADWQHARSAGSFRVREILYAMEKSTLPDRSTASRRQRASAHWSSG